MKKNILVVFNEKSSEGNTNFNDTECYIWPKAIQGTVPVNLLTNEEEREIVELLGEDSLARIRFISESFIVKKSITEMSQ